MAKVEKCALCGSAPRTWKSMAGTMISVQGAHANRCSIAPLMRSILVTEWNRLQRAIRARSGKVGRCTWTEDADGVWHTECGEAWTFECDGPKENRVTFCHHCGRRVKVGKERGA